MKGWIRALFDAPRQRPAEPRRPALRPQTAGDPAWWQVMGFSAGPPRCLDNVERRFRILAARLHPDRGGSDGQMQALLRARARARLELRP